MTGKISSSVSFHQYFQNLFLTVGVVRNDLFRENISIVAQKFAKRCK